MKMSLTGFDEAAERVLGLNALARSQKLVKILMDSLEPARAAAIGNVHSVTGKTVAGLVISAGKGRKLSANLKVDKKTAYAFWYGKPYAYPYAVEFGHGKTPAHAFFDPAVQASKSEMASIAENGLEGLFRDYVSNVGIGSEFL